MSTPETWTLWVHIAAGVVAVGAGGLAVVTRKGGLWHRRAGKTFVAAMGIVVVTTFGLVAFEPSDFRLFLGLVAVFSGYLAFSGYRVLSRKRPADTAEAIDWLAAVAVLVASFVLGGWGVGMLLDGEVFGTVLTVFGVIGIAFGGLDVRAFRTDPDGGPRSGGNWMVGHLQRMLGAFIATVSAVSAVNLTGTLGFLAWLWPTAVGIPLIVYASRRYDTE